MREGKTRYVILGLLTEGPMSGYTIKKLIDLRFRFFWSESYGQLYPELKALLREGLVEAAPTSTSSDLDERVMQALAVESGGGMKRPRPQRFAYRITPAGRDSLREWLVRPAERESVRIEILLKLYFARQGDRTVLIQQIREFEEHYASEIALLLRFQAELERLPDEAGDHRDILRVIDFGQKTYGAYLDWSHQTLVELEGR